MFRNPQAARDLTEIHLNTHRRIAAACITFAAMVGCVIVSRPHPVAAQAAPVPGSPEFYTQRVQPILQANCYRCHGGFNHRGGLSLATKAGMLRGGHDGTVLIPGDPQKSLLIRLIRHEGPADDPMPMPPKGKISDADIATITQWVQAGAVTPPDQIPQ